jgi:hypothetical protein
LPIAAVSCVIVRDGADNVTRNADFEVRDAARTAQARFTRLLDRRRLHGRRGRGIAATPGGHRQPRGEEARAVRPS